MIRKISENALCKISTAIVNNPGISVPELVKNTEYSRRTIVEGTKALRQQGTVNVCIKLGDNPGHKYYSTE